MQGKRNKKKLVGCLIPEKKKIHPECLGRDDKKNIWAQTEVADGWKESAKEKTSSLYSAPNILTMKSSVIRQKGM
jgi:hypothetical protein